MLKQNLLLKLSQKIAPQQIQLIKMLGLSTEEFKEYVEQEIEENPALNEKKENEINVDDYIQNEQTPYYKTQQRHQIENKKQILHSEEMSFLEYLMEQLRTFNLNQEHLKIAEFLIGSMDKHGYIRRKNIEIVDDLALMHGIFTEEKIVEKIISKTIQKLEPSGIGARNLQECLLIQMHKNPKNEIANICCDILEKSFDGLVHKHYDKILKTHKIEKKTLKKCLDNIRKLNPKPGTPFGNDYKMTEHITPDFTIEVIDNSLKLSLNYENIPQLHISKSYENLLQSFKENKKPTQSQKDSVLFVKQKLDSAKWFIQAVQQRRDTLLKTMNAIMNHQRDYLLTGDESKLKPLILKDISDIIEMDISTVSRVANSKYVVTPYGLKLIKFFFSETVKKNEEDNFSSKQAKNVLFEIIKNEDKNNPLNDDELILEMTKKGYKIARRTAAKYRKQMNIPIAKLRRKYDFEKSEKEKTDTHL